MVQYGFIEQETAYWSQQRLTICRVLAKDKEQDDVDAERNLELYELYIAKLKDTIYQKRPGNPVQTLEKGREKFQQLSAANQAQALISIHQIFGRTGRCDLSLIGGKENTAASQLNYKFSVSKKSYTDVRIIDTSAAGLYEHKSPNLLDFLEDA